MALFTRISPFREKGKQIFLLVEAKTGLDLRYLLRGGLWILIGRAASLFLTFLLSIVFANCLSKDTYGSYKFLLSIAGTLVLFTFPGMGTALSHAVARGFDKTLISITRFRMWWGGVGALVGVGVAGYYAIHQNIIIAIAVLITSAFLPFMDPFSSFSVFLQGKKEFKRDTVYSNIIQSVATVVLIGIVYFTGDLLLILTGYFLIYTLLRLFFFKRTLKSIDPDATTDPEAISYGKHLSVMNILGTVATNLDAILLFHLLGPSGVAVYSVAVAPSDQVKSFLGLPDKLLFPRFVKHPEKDIRYNVLSKVFGYAVFAVFLLVVYYMMAPWFFYKFFPKYTDAIGLSLVYSLSMLTAGFAPFVIFHSAKRQIRTQYYCTVSTYVFQIISMVCLTPLFGVSGLIWARICTKFFGGFINLFFFLRNTSRSEGVPGVFSR